jgi:hypothetical protein
MTKRLLTAKTKNDLLWITGTWCDPGSGSVFLIDSGGLSLNHYRQAVMR